VILVFDAYKVKGNPGSVERLGGLDVVYTKEAETADAYIERVTRQIAKHNDVTVATSDGLEQIIIWGHGARRMSAAELKADIEEANIEIASFIRNQRSDKVTLFDGLSEDEMDFLEEIRLGRKKWSE
jgi:predicted RNA-binding protein with PIN domain